MTAVPHRSLEELDAAVDAARLDVEEHAARCATMLASGLECQRCLELDAEYEAAILRRDAAESQIPDRPGFGDEQAGWAA